MINIKSLACGSLLVCGALAFSSCEDSFNPAPERKDDLNSFLKSPEYSIGILTNIYSRMPYGSDWTFTFDKCINDCMDVDPENASNILSQFWSVTNGGFSGDWSSYLSAINYCNIFIAHMGITDWTGVEAQNELFNRRAKGEVYGLRGLFGYYLLREFAGKTADGQYLGYPVFTAELAGDGSDFNMSRNTVAECVDQIIADLDVAIAELPETYRDFSVKDITDEMKEKGITFDIYNKFMGSICTGLMDGRIAKAIKSQVLLLVTSAAYDGSTTYTTADAAKAAAEVIDICGGIKALEPEGATFYTKVQDKYYPAEIIWRPNNKDASHSLEQSLLPPSLNGNGTVNPSQNLVDAFPMADGTPIAKSSDYNSSNPFANRDPRLDMYILHDGSTFGSATLHYGTGTVNDGIGGEQGKASKTGYYVKKFLHEDVHTNDKGEWTNDARHNFVFIRLTEIALNYAEAANAAYGPKADGGNGFSAYDVIKAIRERSGITNTTYLDACAGSTKDMEDLIKNERRIELCFENHRFFDLRRWNDLTELNTSLKSAEGKDVNTYKYKDYMIYSPVPNAEILKWDNLVQNYGW